MERPNQPNTDDGDEISGLHDDVLIRILSALDNTVEAVRSGILSSRWRHLWKRAPTLHFDFAVFPKRHDSGCWERDLADDSRAFVEFVKHSLTLHTAPQLHKFHLKINEWPDALSKEISIDSWLRIALGRHVQHLHLCGYGEFIGDQYPVPTWFSSCPTLINLHLEHCLIKFQQFDYPALTHLEVTYGSLGIKECAPMNSLSVLRLSDMHFYGKALETLLAACTHLQELTLERLEVEGGTQFPCFDSLRVLLLFEVTVGNVTFTRLLSCCPVLEDLTLECTGSDRLILSPNLHLKRLAISNSCCFRSIGVVVKTPHICVLKAYLRDFCELSLVEMLSLKTADLSFRNVDFSPAKCRHLLMLLKNVGHAESLLLNAEFVKQMSLFVAKDLHQYLINAKCLEMHMGLSSINFSGLTNMLWCSPAIETLILTWDLKYRIALNDETCNFDEAKFHEFLTLSIYCLEDKLKIIKIIVSYRNSWYFLFCKGPLLWLVRFLLKRARVLKNLTIHVNHLSTSLLEDVFSSFSQELTSMPRASPNVEVAVLSV